MAPAERDHEQSENNQNVLVRLRNLPSVNSTFEMIGRSYTTAKAANPLLSSVCGVCEEGVKSAGSLAAKSMHPAVHILQPQLVAVNSLACKGLDHLEKKIPAIEYPPVKLAAGITDLLSSAIQSPAVQYVLSSKLSQLAEEGAGTALFLTERLVNYILPETSEEKVKELSEAQKSSVGAAGPKPGFVRLGALASTFWKRVYGQTSMQFQRIKSRGQKMAERISIVTSKLPAQPSKPREDILFAELEHEKAGGTLGHSNGSPAVEFNGADQRNRSSRSSKEESVKDGESMEEQSSEELRFFRSKQILEESHQSLLWKPET